MNARSLRLAGPATLVVAAVLTMIAGLAIGGGAAEQVTLDPGAFVRWGLPTANLAVNLSAALMAGPLVLALYALRTGTPAFERAMTASSIGAAVFTLASATTGFLTYLNAFPSTPSLDAVFGQQLGRFFVELEVGRAWALSTLLGAVLTVLIFAVRSWTAVLLTTILALVALVPMATAGHAGDAADHTIAVTSLALHIVAAAVWVGGLLLLVFIRPLLGGALPRVLERYSTIALVAFIVVTVSGYARTLVSIGAWSELTTPYGIILLVKVLALVAMGLLGALYRRRLIARIADGATNRRFWGLIGLELAFMGIASGAAAALARTAPPRGEQAIANPTPAEVLTDAPLPPELTPLAWITEWRIDVLWTLLCAGLVFFYVAGARRLRARGDHWPVFRTVLWLVGVTVFFWVTNGAVAVYENYLFSVHMLGHMLLTMAVPLLLVAGAPVTLALRAIRKRSDGTRGGREWILWAVHSPFARVVTNPFVAAGIFVGSLWVFYYTDLFRWALYDHLGHIWMVLHFLISGFLFVQSLIGIDPVPYRLPYAGRLITLIAVMAIHAFFGVSIMMQTGLMAAEWFGSMGREWGPTPLEDQYIGGGVAWSIGEIPTLILAITVAIQWSRNDAKAQRRSDRHSDRTGDAELAEYNARLARIAERDAQASGRP